MLQVTEPGGQLEYPCFTQIGGEEESREKVQTKTSHFSCLWIVPNPYILRIKQRSKKIRSPGWERARRREHSGSGKRGGGGGEREG